MYVEMLLKVEEEVNQEQFLQYLGVLTESARIRWYSWPLKRGIAAITVEVADKKEAKAFIKETEQLDGMIFQEAIEEKFEERATRKVHMGVVTYSEKYHKFIENFLEERLNLKPEYKYNDRLMEVFVNVGETGYELMTKYTKRLGDTRVSKEKIRIDTAKKITEIKKWDLDD